LEESRPSPAFASYTLAIALQLRKKHGKPSVRVDVAVVSKHPSFSPSSNEVSSEINISII
jgi:hypothetical protein